MATNRKEHSRYRYGICLNDQCPKYKLKKMQKIVVRKDFVCEECQKPLRECPPPKSFWNKYGKIITNIAGCLIAVAVIIGIIYMPSKSKTDSAEGKIEQPEQVEQQDTDTKAIAPVDNTIKQDDLQKKQLTTPTSKPKVKQPSIQVPFGIYSGPDNGLDGEIQVTQNYSLDLRNAAHETIELRSGDMITHTKFKNGELVSGQWQRGAERRTFHR